MGVPWGCRRVTSMSITIAVSLKAHLMRWAIIPIQARRSNTCVGIVCASDILWERRARLLPSYHETNSQAATYFYIKKEAVPAFFVRGHTLLLPLMWQYEGSSCDPPYPANQTGGLPPPPHMQEIHSDVLMPNVKLPEVLWVGSSVSNTLKWYQNRRPLSQRIANAQNRRFLLLLSWDLVL